MPEHTITQIVDLEGGGGAEMRLEKFGRWVVTRVTVDGLGDLPRDMESSYGSEDEAAAAAHRAIETATGKKVVRTKR